MKTDNIAAISTGMVASGVAVIRISGPSPLQVAEKMFKPLGKTKVCDFEPNKMYPGEIVAKGFNDFGMCVYFKAPKSFTGEDSVEFHSHGGLAITKGILNKIFSLGVRPATNGEFTKRAFLNGKLSLSSAEGLIDMINSESESGVKAGYYLYREKLLSAVNSIQDRLTDSLSQIDVDMDFPEEDIEQTATPKIKQDIEISIQKLDSLLSTYRTGRTLKDGVKVGIVGKPNTGKSSTLNALLNYDKAIVSSVAGTTRDIVEGSIDINGVRFNFSDTAGIRESDDEIEEIGVSLSKRVLNESDLIVFIADASDFDSSDEQILQSVIDKNLLFVMNKTDKSDFKHERADIYISALEKINVDGLRQAIYDKTALKGLDLSGDFLCEERHFDALSRAKTSLVSALNSIESVSLDILAIDVKDAWDALGEISGKTATEEIINNIFSKFCVGK
ncbi:MAG: tRNA uridine-5-carboxymethylaminomethyl(34) synthesis GTPase MnmE [Clostridia bacterium]|nr:tRNA uridine-5-carboxymethylaminomethyl(34) synthesis GTPase MnmE [Clostridia bacterium]